MGENQGKEPVIAETRAITAAEQPISLSADDLAILSLYVSLLSSFIDLASLYLDKEEDVSDIFGEDEGSFPGRVL